MDGENNGKPYFLVDDLGGKPTIFGNIHINFTTKNSFQEVYLRRRACEALGCQGKEMGAIGTLALKKAAEDRRETCHIFSSTREVFVGLVIFWGLQHQPHFLVRDFLVAEKEVLKHQGTRTLMYIV